MIANPTGVSYALRSESCTCIHEAWPEVGACAERSDHVGCHCDVTGCPTAVFVRDHERVLASAEPGLEPLTNSVVVALGASSLELVVEGCGGTIVAPLPTEFPASPVITTTEPTASGVHVEWQSSPNTSSLLRTFDTFAGTECLAGPGVQSFDVPAPGAQAASVTALAPPLSGPGFAIYAASR